MDESLTASRLLMGAERFARSAMDAHTKDDSEVFLLHAGVSIERLAKAVLAETSPFLLMEMKGSDDTLFHLTGVREAAKVRTIGAAQSITRLRKMGRLPIKDDDLDELIELRNGVAHLIPDNDDSFDGLAVFARTTRQLLAGLSVTEVDFWGIWASMVEITLNDVMEQAARDLGRLTEQAKVRLSQRIDKLPPAAAEAYVESMMVRSPHINTRSMILQVSLPKECPTCGYMGQITTGPPPLAEKGRLGEAYPVAFNCQICSLYLGTSDLLTAAGMNHPVPLVNSEGNRFFSEDTERWLLEIAVSSEGEDFLTPP
ncbi:hypothetical protein [Actinacidiphila oryziradicis]|uniref:Uncharacterized protein n=1 Tax=Actinacidiphila oryziradicis TaxID=2571141 RepID=A0A4U0RF22_9ACTN|nr:hypothetical protein [Actinacidiphila oryziradicis]TJZ93210.1 hypothetical protein FCI23_54585 [Actinacidiphila oryziradicis]